MTYFSENESSERHPTIDVSLTIARVRYTTHSVGSVVFYDDSRSFFYSITTPVHDWNPYKYICISKLGNIGLYHSVWYNFLLISMQLIDTATKALNLAGRLLRLNLKYFKASQRISKFDLSYFFERWTDVIGQPKSFSEFQLSKIFIEKPSKWNSAWTINFVTTGSVDHSPDDWINFEIVKYLPFHLEHNSLAHFSGAISTLPCFSFLFCVKFLIIFNPYGPQCFYHSTLQFCSTIPLIHWLSQNQKFSPLAEKSAKAFFVSLFTHGYGG